MKQIKFTRRVIRTISFDEVCTLDLEAEAKWLDYPEGVTEKDVLAWAESDDQDDQEKLAKFVWDNECYSEIDYDEELDCHDCYLDEIFDIEGVD